MYYIITNGNHYCAINKKNACLKTVNKNEATKFATDEQASATLQRCSKKLKNFWVLPVYDESNNDPSKCKRRIFTANERKIIYSKNKGCCAICGDFIPFDEFTVDHIIPLAKGGTNDAENLQCACDVCNRIKQDILPKDLMDKLSQIILYQMERSFDNNLFYKINRIRKIKNKKNIIKLVSGIKKY